MENSIVEPLSSRRSLPSAHCVLSGGPCDTRTNKPVPPALLTAVSPQFLTGVKSPSTLISVPVSRLPLTPKLHADTRRVFLSGKSGHFTAVSKSFERPF